MDTPQGCLTICDNRITFNCDCMSCTACCCGASGSCEGDIQIRSSVVTAGQRFNVGLIRAGAFSESDIKSVLIPKTVKFLPERCFERCRRLSSVSFEEESLVSAFGDMCFKGCAMCEFCVPDSVHLIGSKCFDGCCNLCRVDLNETSQLVKIGSFAFRGCHISRLFLPRDLDLTECFYAFVGVKSVSLSSDCHFCLDNESLVSVDGRTMIACFSSSTTYRVNDSITRVYHGCFSCSLVRVVVFGSFSFVSVLDGAFHASTVDDVIFERANAKYFREDGVLFERLADNTNKIIYRLSHDQTFFVPAHVSCLSEDLCVDQTSLKVVRFDDSHQRISVCDNAFRLTSVEEAYLSCVSHVGCKSFYGCKCLKSVCFDDFCDIREFSTKSFGFSGLESLCVPRSVETIGKKCFYGCCHLKRVDFERGSQLRRICEKAFMNTKLCELFVPCFVRDVYGTTFCGVPNVTLDSNPHLQICDCFLVSPSTGKLISVMNPLCGDVVIPANVRTLGRQCFYRQIGVRTVSFLAGCCLDRIEDDAFQYCSIDCLHLPASVSYLGNNIGCEVKCISVAEGNGFFDLDGFCVTRVVGCEEISLLHHFGVGNVLPVPDYVSCICNSCFEGQRRDGFSVSFSASGLCEVRELCDFSFRDSSLTSIEIPSTVTRLGNSCFCGCYLLSQVLFADDCIIESFGSRCFFGSSISFIRIPASVELLPDHCFENCFALDSVSLLPVPHGQCHQFFDLQCLLGE